MHLNSTAEQYTIENERIRSLVEHLRSPHAESPRYVTKLMRAAGFEPSQPFLLPMKADSDRSDLWRLRQQLLGILANPGFDLHVHSLRDAD